MAAKWFAGTRSFLTRWAVSDSGLEPSTEI